MTLTLLSLCGCENGGNGDEHSVSTNFDGMWGIVADYVFDDGFTYYYSDSWYLIKVSENDMTVYESDNDGYPFERGYYDCSRSNFTYSFSTSFTVKDNKAYFQPNEDAYTYMKIKDGKLYLYDAYSLEDGYFEVYERVKGFTRD